MHESERQRLLKATKADADRFSKMARGSQAMWRVWSLLGSLAVVFVIPVVAGAYLGSWLDGWSGAYSSRATVSCVILGTAIGIYNVYRAIKGH